MTFPLLIIVAAVVVVTFILIFRVQALATVLRGSDKPGLSNKINGFLFLVFFAAFAVGYIYYTLEGEYGLPTAASEHGIETDKLMVVTMVIISIAMLITNFLLMYFSFKYQHKDGYKAKFFPENHTLELVWTVVPALVLTYLVIQGEGVWTAITNPTKEMRAEKVELEIVGSQFKWEVRYPGVDGQLGSHQFEALSSENTFGINLSDERGYDDFQVTKIVLPKGKPVHFKIRAKDVIHSVFAPHFRSKMDAVPGMPTEFWFTPTQTTVEKREELASHARYGVADAEGNVPAESFNYEIACTEVCGRGHNSMRFVVEIVEEAVYDEWYAAQAKKAAFVVLSEEYIKENLPSNMKDIFAKKLDQFKEVEETPVLEATTEVISDTVVVEGEAAAEVEVEAETEGEHEGEHAQH